jgi:hypothetical protein
MQSSIVQTLFWAFRVIPPVKHNRQDIINAENLVLISFSFYPFVSWLLVIHSGIYANAAEAYLFVVGIKTYIFVILFLKNEKHSGFNFS